MNNSQSRKKMELKSEIEKLVENFKNEKAWNRSEEHIQSLFTIKLLSLLGYDSSNIRINQGQEVKTGKKPDILLFNNSGNTLLVIESKDAAKQDTLDGKYKDKTFIEQLNGYCHAEGIHWGVLTNFVEWRIYSIYQNRLYKEKKYAFHDLLWKNVDKKNYIDLASPSGYEFFEILSKHALTLNKGRIDGDPVYYPKQEEIKEKFFQDLKKWRSSLRSFIANTYRDKYDIDSVDLITQKILDRLIFIDYCSDNNIIIQDRLHAILHSKANLQKELSKIFLDMDEKFNSELFANDDCDNILITDDILKPIIVELSNIDFSKLSVHIIGEVYENYLGELLKAGKKKVSVDISKTSHKRKSQGIYYTPDYIVNYIVQNTVGSILSKCKTVKEIEKIKVADIACGSGSFLISVFDEFLKHYERVSPSGLFHFETRKKILQNNIYGIDLDEKAVEITKLNLLTKALENCSHLDLSGRKILPNIKLNIRRGNSLIFSDINKENLELFWEENKTEFKKLKDLHQNFLVEIEDDNLKKIFNEIQVKEYTINSKLISKISANYKNFENLNSFNYSIAFPKVFEEGGFDCIVGNPPYIFTRNLMTDLEKQYYNDVYTQTEFKLNTYILFSERASNLIKENGYWGFILPNNWLSLETAKKFRTFVLENSSTLKVVNCKDKVFEGASVDTAIAISQKGSTNQNNIQLLNLENKQFEKINELPISSLLKSESRIFNFSNNDKHKPILKKIVSNSISLDKLSIVKNGVQAYTVGEGVPTQTERMKNERVYHSTTKVDNTWIKYVDGVDVSRYQLGWSGQFIKYGENLSRKRTPELFIDERILVRQIPNKPPYCIHACFTDEHLINDNNSMIIKNSSEYSLYYLLGILNSKLMSYWFIHQFGKMQRKIFPQFKVKELRIFPIAKIDKKDPNYTNLVELVKKRVKLGVTNLENIQRQSLDNQIDKIVYEMYKLTISEKELIENISI
jgi:methylase of polypeptide subunit release factors